MKSRLKNRIKTFIYSVPYYLFKVDEKCILEDLTYISKLNKVYKFLLKFFPKYPFAFFFMKYAEKINMSISGDIRKEENYKNRLIKYYIRSSIDEKMFIWCMMAVCKITDERITRLVVSDLKKSNDKLFCYWIGMDISYVTFGVGKGIYDNFFVDRRAVFEKITNENKLNIPQCHSEVPNKFKVCIIVYQLMPDIHNSVLRVCTTVANNFSLYADSVMILCLDSTYKSLSESKRYYTICRTPNSYKNRKKNKTFFDDDITIKYSIGRNYKERAQDGIKKLYEYNPSMVIDISDEYSPFSYLYAKDFYTVYLPMRRGVSCQLFNSIITTKCIFKRENITFNNVNKEVEVIDWIFPEYVPATNKDITKEDIGLSKNAYVIISIGNNGAFEKEIIDEMCKFLLSEPDTVWLLVGYPAPDYLRFIGAELIKNRKIIEWGYENNLIGICAAADVVLRQNITGGSGGTAIAAMKGLPIVMTNVFCDASRWLGDDYSTISDSMGLINEIRKLKNDPLYYAEQQRKVKMLVDSVIDSKEKWKKLYDLIKESFKGWKLNSDGKKY